jgi:hypothetical protein
LGFQIVFREIHEQADAPYPSGLLSARRERPRGRAAEQRNQLASFQLIELHSVPVSQGRIAGYRIGEDESAGIAGILQPVSGAEVRCGSDTVEKGF